MSLITLREFYNRAVEGKSPMRTEVLQTGLRRRAKDRDEAILIIEGQGLEERAVSD